MLYISLPSHDAIAWASVPGTMFVTPDLILPYDGVLPAFASDPVHCGRGSTVIGAASIGHRAWLGADSVIRADGQTITIGKNFRLGARGTVHIATDTLATIVGDRVSTGRNAVIHACTVGSDVVIEDDCVILDGATVGDSVLLEAGSIVFPRATLDAGFVYGGCPAKPRGPITRAQIADRAACLRDARDESDDDAHPQPAPVEASVFVARTASVSGSVTFGSGTSVLFSCDLDAQAGPITVGADSNIQDNSVVRATGQGVVIGRETTIGHNVRMHDCRIGARSLIGIGCVIETGTIVADDVLLAAGAVTEPGQLLESGHLWGGRPARILAPLDDDKRAMMRRTIEGYCAHGRAYRRAQESAG